MLGILILPPLTVILDFIFIHINVSACGFDTAIVVYVPGVPEVLYCAAVPTVVTVVHLPVHPFIGAAEVVTVTGCPLIQEVPAVPTVPPVTVQPYQQHDLLGIFQNCIAKWSSQIYIALSKSYVFKKNLRQQQIVNQNVGQGYMTPYQLVATEHSVSCKLYVS